jgi:hypothetical protein
MRVGHRGQHRRTHRLLVPLALRGSLLLLLLVAPVARGVLLRLLHLRLILLLLMVMPLMLLIRLLILIVLLLLLVRLPLLVALLVVAGGVVPLPLVLVRMVRGLLLVLLVVVVHRRRHRRRSERRRELVVVVVPVGGSRRARLLASARGVTSRAAVGGAATRVRVLHAARGMRVHQHLRRTTPETHAHRIDDTATHSNPCEAASHPMLATVSSLVPFVCPGVGARAPPRVRASQCVHAPDVCARRFDAARCARPVLSR